MNGKAAAGLLFVAGLVLIITGFSGRLGDLLAAVFAPEDLALAGAAKNGGGSAGSF